MNAQITLINYITSSDMIRDREACGSNESHLTEQTIILMRSLDTIVSLLIVATSKRVSYYGKDCFPQAGFPLF
jgi:hypothetical protein